MPTGPRGDYIVTSCIEHKAVLQTCQHLEKQGFGVTCPAVDQCHPWLHATQRRDKDVGARDGNIQRVKTKQERQRGWRMKDDSQEFIP